MKKYYSLHETKWTIGIIYEHNIRQLLLAQISTSYLLYICSQHASNFSQQPFRHYSLNELFTPVD